MEIIQDYKQDENQIVLESNTGLSFLVNYEEDVQITEIQGFIDYDSEPDKGCITFDVDILDCFVCNEDNNKISACTTEEKRVIKNYMIDLIENEYEY
jgi:hypothetical protein